MPVCNKLSAKPPTLPRVGLTWFLTHVALTVPRRVRQQEPPTRKTGQTPATVPGANPQSPVLRGDRRLLATAGQDYAEAAAALEQMIATYPTEKSVR